ncbi:MAG TPA: TolC family protein [Nitrospirae bacterium]|nr:outer membrane protein TolC precursor [bacterium BMS3Abin06]HDH13019.1 TolC family protein [Nitrospirota bacterium]HDZ02943.1 TolC family protein [Nitrospirota bacterium]
MRIKCLFIFYFLLVSVPTTVYAREYSLNDLYRLALERSETIKIAEENLYISERGKDRAMAVLFPTLSAFANHTEYTKEELKNTAVLQPERTNEWGLRLDQSLSLSGREFTAFRIAGEGIKQSSYDLESIKERYLLNVASSYYETLKSEKALEIAGANVERLTLHRNAAWARLKAGSATKTDLLRAEAELAGAESELIISENRVRLALAVLARTVGLRGDYDIKEPRHEKEIKTRRQELIDALKGDCLLTELDCIKEKAFSERPEIKRAGTQKQIAEYEVKYSKGAYWPSLSIEGGYVRQESEPSNSFRPDESIYGAVKIKFPFFEGGLRTAEVREARARLRQAEHNLADIKHSVGVEVEDSYLNLLTVSAVIDRLQAEVKYARDNFNAVTKQFQYGLSNSIDVMDANTLLTTAERKLAGAEYDYQLAILKLKRATGTLLKSVAGY